MFGFNFFRKRDDQPPANSQSGAEPQGKSRDQANEADLSSSSFESRGPLMDRVLIGLDNARNKFIRFTPAGSSTAAEFHDAILPGDLLIAGEEMRLICGITGQGTGRTYKTLRLGRCEDLELSTVKARKIPMAIDTQVISSRSDDASSVYARAELTNMDPMAFKIASTLLGAGETGRSFRQIIVHGNQTAYAAVDPETGAIATFGRTDKPVPEKARVALYTSSVFDTDLNFIRSMVLLDECSDRAHRNLSTAMAIVNSFENARRLIMIEGITGRN